MVESEESPASMAPVLIPTSEWSVSVYRSCEGGGTGQEFYTNLQVPGDSPGNKWYDYCSGETWIQADFKEPKNIRMLTLKSANDCPERDPAKISVMVKYEKSSEFEVIDVIDDIVFSTRYEVQEFHLCPDSKIKTIRLQINLNKSMKDSSNWGSGTQLSECNFYS